MVRLQQAARHYDRNFTGQVYLVTAKSPEFAGEAAALQDHLNAMMTPRVRRRLQRELVRDMLNAPVPIDPASIIDLG